MVSSSLAKKLSLITVLGILLLSACGSTGNNIADSQSVSSSLDSSDTIMNEEASFESMDNSDSTNELSNEDITPQDVLVDVVEVEESTVNEESASDSTSTPDSTLLTEEAPDSPLPTDSSLPLYTITPLPSPLTLFAQSSVSIRNYPSTDGERVGSFQQNDEVIVVGQCQETGWYQLEDGNFVTNSKKYLGSEKYVVKVEVSESAVSESSGSESVSVSAVSGSESSSVSEPTITTNSPLPTPEPEPTPTPDSSLTSGEAVECALSPDGKHYSVKDGNIWFDATLCAYCGTHTSCYHEGYTKVFGYDEEVGHSYTDFTCPICGVFDRSYAIN